MSLIVMADDGIGLACGTVPGEAQGAFVDLAEAFATLGHRVLALSSGIAPISRNGVEWVDLADGVPERPDLFICNHDPQLLGLAPKARQVILWVHHPAPYLATWRNQLRLAWQRPVIVFAGKSHLANYPGWAFDGGREIIPYGLAERFRRASERPPPPPRAVFTANPLRSLGWLLDLWAARIHPAVPAAELHVFRHATADVALPVFERAAGMAGVVLRVEANLEEARVLMYRGDIGETFCLAAAEAQAMGVPAVVEDIACMAERVIDGETGFVVDGPDAFADAAVRLLTDDALWRTQHRGCLKHQRGLSWQDVARRFLQELEDGA